MATCEDREAVKEMIAKIEEIFRRRPMLFELPKARAELLELYNRWPIRES
jgi:hypothetical protein